MKKILVLFPNEWDRYELSTPRFRGRFRFCYEGFDVLRFPQNAALLLFSARRYVERVVARYRHERLAGVLSTDDQLGAMIAALVARRLGLPGASPESVLLAQHKYYARVAQRGIAPESTPRFCAFPY